MQKLLGQKFGRLTVVGEAETRQSGKRYWLCRCICDSQCWVETNKLRSGNTKSCGCLNDETRGTAAVTHGESRNGKISPRLKMFLAAKSRSKKNGKPFDITLNDINIPAVCPILGIPLVQHSEKCDYDSPSLDQVIPGAGYTKNNIQVISHKANTIKSNASLEELKKVVAYLESQRERLKREAPEMVKQ